MLLPIQPVIDAPPVDPHLMAPSVLAAPLGSGVTLVWSLLRSGRTLRPPLTPATATRQSPRAQRASALPSTANKAAHGAVLAAVLAARASAAHGAAQGKSLGLAMMKRESANLPRALARQPHPLPRSVQTMLPAAALVRIPKKAGSHRGPLYQAVLTTPLAAALAVT